MKLTTLAMCTVALAAVSACTGQPDCVSLQQRVEAMGMVVPDVYDSTGKFDRAPTPREVTETCPIPPTTPPSTPQEPPCVDCPPPCNDCEPEPELGGNPGNGIPVGNSPYDGITGNSGNNDPNRGSPEPNVMDPQRDDVAPQPSGGDGPSS